MTRMVGVVGVVNNMLLAHRRGAMISAGTSTTRNAVTNSIKDDATTDSGTPIPGIEQLYARWKRERLNLGARELECRLRLIGPLAQSAWRSDGRLRATMAQTATR